MGESANHSAVQAICILLASVVLVLGVACGTPAAAPTPLSLPGAVAPTGGLSSSNVTPSQLPRQHSRDHIAGLDAPLDAPNFVDSYPNHAQTLVQSPRRVILNFDVAQTDESGITVEKDGTVIAAGTPQFDKRKITLTLPLPANSGDGLYRIHYRACQPDAECAKGELGFAVDSTREASFLDWTGRAQVTIQLHEIQYSPTEIVVSPGTRVTWVNDDPFEHFVNSDPHPTHNGYPDLNSLDIPPGGSFEFTFQEPGEYPYHCSAHVPQDMYGRVIVR